MVMGQTKIYQPTMELNPTSSTRYRSMKGMMPTHIPGSEEMSEKIINHNCSHNKLKNSNFVISINELLFTINLIS